MKLLRRSLVGLFLVSLTLALLAFAGGMLKDAVVARLSAEPPSFPQRERSVTANVVTVESGTLTPQLEVFGQILSSRTLDLRAPVGGTVLEVSDRFVDGGTVEAGEVLLRIDPVEAEAALARVEADLADAEAEARDAERALALAQDGVAAAEAQQVLREQALQRQRDLQARSVGTATELEAAELAVSSAAQAVLSQREAVAQAEARIDQAATLLARTQIELSEAQRTLDDTVLTAAFDGTLAEVTVVPGGRVTENEQLAQLVDPDALEVGFRLSTSQYAALLSADGQLLPAPVEVTIEVSGALLTATGQISRESASVAEGQTGRLIYARLDEPGVFRPGDFVGVTVEEPAQERVARLPASALAADGTVLVVAEGNRLQLAEVELVRRQSDDVLVRAPDLEGARVVAQRSPLLGPGILVQPLDPTAPEEATVVASAGPPAGSAGPPGAGASQPGAAADPQTEMIVLEPDRRARLVAFVQSNERMPMEAKSRILSQLEAEAVPAAVVARLESQMES